MAPKYVLTYFDVRGRGEVTRLLFKVAGVEFEDKRLTFEEWGKEKENMKSAGKVPFGQLPVLEVDGTLLAQSMAIGRFVANELGFTPSTNLGKAQADMIVDGCSDFGEKIVRPRFEKDEVKKAQLEEEAKAATPGLLKCFEDILKANNGGKGFFVGDKLTFADISVFNILNYAWFDPNDPLSSPEELKKFPILAEHYERIKNVPAIKKWLQERPVTHL